MTSAAPPAVAMQTLPPNTQVVEVRVQRPPVAEAYTNQVVRARRWAITAIVWHVVTFLAFGFFVWATWVATLLVVMPCSIMFCCAGRESYLASVICCSIAILFDVVAGVTWLAIHSYYQDTESNFGWISIFPLVAAVVSLFSAIMIGKAMNTFSPAQAASGVGVASDVGVVTIPVGPVVQLGSKDAPPPYYDQGQIATV